MASWPMRWVLERYALGLEICVLSGGLMSSPKDRANCFILVLPVPPTAPVWAFPGDRSTLNHRRVAVAISDMGTGHQCDHLHRHGRGERGHP